VHTAVRTKLVGAQHELAGYVGVESSTDRHVSRLYSYSSTYPSPTVAVEIITYLIIR
jgi:hypothetical protein